MFWFRVDNRLVHGQVIEGWLPYLDARELIVVNDALATDVLRQQIMQLAIPGRIRVSFVPVADAKKLYDSLGTNEISSLFLFADCQDVARVVEQGVRMSRLNVGNMHYAMGKRQICTHVAVSEDDVACFAFLRNKGIELDFRCVPGDDPVVEEW